MTEAAVELNEDDKHDPHYAIGGQKEANWALSKLRYYRSRMAENDELFGEELERLTQWRKDVNTPLERSAIYFEQLLKNWHAEMFATDEKRKSIKLPNGTLKSTQTQDKPIIVDEAAFMAEAPKELVRVKYEPDKTAIKEYIKTNGAIPAGVEIERGERVFKVEVS